MPKDYNALLAATPAQASKKNGGLPPADTLKNTGLQFLPELDELNLTATASEEDDLFSALTTLTPDAVVQEFGDEDDTGLACGDCGDGEDCDNGEEDNAFLPDGDGDEDDGEFGADTGLSALPELQDEDVSFATSLEALANPDNYADMDVLDGMEKLKVCIAYEYRGKRTEYAPLDAQGWEECTPVYLEFPGWSENTHGITEWDQLPPAARAYLRALEELAGCPISIVSTGPDRDHTIMVKHPFLA